MQLFSQLPEDVMICKCARCCKACIVDTDAQHSPTAAQLGRRHTRHMACSSAAAHALCKRVTCRQQAWCKRSHACAFDTIRTDSLPPQLSTLWNAGPGNADIGSAAFIVATAAAATHLNTTYSPSKHHVPRTRSGAAPGARHQDNVLHSMPSCRQRSPQRNRCTDVQHTHGPAHEWLVHLD
jgi:hypothetical protein